MEAVRHRGRALEARRHAALLAGAIDPHHGVRRDGIVLRLIEHRAQDT